MACSLKSNILIFKIFHKDRKIRVSQLAAFFLCMAMKIQIHRNIERNFMIVLGIAEVIGMLFCAGIMYCCILVGKHSEEEERCLWEMKHFQEKKVEDKDEWEDRES